MALAGDVRNVPADGVIFDGRWKRHDSVVVFDEDHALLERAELWKPRRGQDKMVTGPVPLG